MPWRARLGRGARLAHRWLGWVVGIQVVIWLGTGLVMSLLAKERVRSEDLRAWRSPPPLEAGSVTIPITGLISQLSAQGTSTAAVTLRTVAGRVAYDIESVDGSRLLVDAGSGEVLSPIAAELAERIARFDRSESDSKAVVRKLEHWDGAYRGRLPVWRVEFRDEASAHVYVSPITGEIVARTNDLWRLHDLVWMLHIMDYQDRVDYNNLLLRIAAGLAVVFAISGLILGVVTMRRSIARRSRDPGS